MNKTVWIASMAASAMMAIVPLALSSTNATPRHAGPATSEVKIDDFRFAPATLTVAVGTTVTWTNRDDTPHMIVSTDGVFHSEARDTDEKFSYTFGKAGTYRYYCSIHPKMTGKIVVQS